MAGKLNFTIPGNPGAQIINQGKITVQEGGMVALVAPSVQNSGLITARLGKVALASANSVTIDLYGDNLILFSADSTITEQLKDAFGNPLSAAMENSGTIDAEGGWVLLSAEVAKNVVDKAINMTGYIKATTADQQEGTIILKAMGGEVTVSGTLDASAPNGGDGGFIETSGAHVTIDPAATITTVAPWGATGQWLIDPTNYYIAASGGDITGSTLASYLANSNVEIQTATTGGEAGDIYVSDSVTWYNFNKLTLSAYRNIYVYKPINANGGGSVLLRADNTGAGVGTVAFGGTGHITVKNGAAVGIYYNPLSYTNAATRSYNSGNPYSSYVTGGTMDAFMLVNTVNQLQAMNTNLAGHYALGRDIDASATAGWNGGAGFVPIGSGTGSFLGSLSGLGHEIINLTINRPSTPFVGLLGHSSGMLRDIGLVHANITGGDFTGGLAGYNYGTILNSFVSGGVTGWYGIGGLVGDNFGSITKSYNTSIVTSLMHCVGGVAGHNRDGGTISNSYSTGNIIGMFSGGLVGHTDSESSITNSYSTGAVSEGGLVSTSSNVGVIATSYWNTETSGRSTSYGGTGLSTAQMKQQASYAGWNFTNIWTIQNGVSYPTLRTVSTPATTILRPDGVVYGPSTGTLIVKYQSADAATLLGGIYAGELRNDRLDPVWRALYVNGVATAAQVEANALENHYRNITASDLMAELKNGTRKSDGTDPVWNVLPLAKRNAAMQILADEANKTTQEKIFDFIADKTLPQHIITNLSHIDALGDLKFLNPTHNMGSLYSVGSNGTLTVSQAASPAQKEFFEKLNTSGAFDSFDQLKDDTLAKRGVDIVIFKDLGAFDIRAGHIIMDSIFAEVSSAEFIRAAAAAQSAVQAGIISPGQNRLPALSEISYAHSEIVYPHDTFVTVNNLAQKMTLDALGSLNFIKLNMPKWPSKPDKTIHSIMLGMNIVTTAIEAVSSVKEQDTLGTISSISNLVNQFIEFVKKESPEEIGALAGITSAANNISKAYVAQQSAVNYKNLYDNLPKEIDGIRLSGDANSMALMMANAREAESKGRIASSIKDIVSVMELFGPSLQTKRILNSASSLVDNIGSIITEMSNAKISDKLIYEEQNNIRKQSFYIDGKDQLVSTYTMDAKTTYDNIKNSLN
ncbi:MAG: hypothetical protein OEV64_06580 [Desulfobulbaceae bacterium]|nr:hypothetical protein [Desulfobulbaceae bacterium]